MGHFKKLLHPFADGEGRNHDDEFREAVAFVQLVDGFDVDIRLARACFHFDAEGELVRVIGKRQVVPALDCVEVLLDLFHGDREGIADAVSKDSAVAEVFAGEIAFAVEESGDGRYGGFLIGLMGKL